MRYGTKHSDESKRKIALKAPIKKSEKHKAAISASMQLSAKVRSRRWIARVHLNGRGGLVFLPREDCRPWGQTLEGRIAMVYLAIKKANVKQFPAWEEFHTWAFKSNLGTIFLEWERMGFTDSWAPALTKRDFKKPYTLANMRWTTNRFIGAAKSQRIAAKKHEQAMKDIEAADRAAGDRSRAYADSPEGIASRERYREVLRQQREKLQRLLHGEQNAK